MGLLSTTRRRLAASLGVIMGVMVVSAAWAGTESSEATFIYQPSEAYRITAAITSTSAISGSKARNTTKSLDDLDIDYSSVCALVRVNGVSQYSTNQCTYSSTGNSLDKEGEQVDRYSGLYPWGTYPATFTGRGQTCFDGAAGFKCNTHVSPEEGGLKP